jgi:Flp pilus assembly protein TadD
MSIIIKKQNLINKTGLIRMAFPALLIVVAIVFSGCAGKSKDMQSRLEYGNPAYKHMKDLPVNNMALSSELADKSEQLHKEMTEDEFERLGDAYLSKGTFHTAYLNYEKALEKKPDNLRIKYKKGIVLLLGKNYTEAINEFNGLIKKDPSFALAYEGLGRAYFMQKDYEGAEIHFNKACRLNPDLWLSRNYLGQIYDNKKQHHEAIKEYNAAIAIVPGEGFLYNNLGFSYFMAGKYPDAVRSYQKAINSGFVTNKVYNNAGLALAAMQRYDEAFEFFKKAVGEARAYNNLGAFYLSNGNYKEAADCFEKAVALAPIFYVEAHDRLKQARRYLGR